MDEPLAIRVNDECFKVNDYRINLLKTGKLSSKGFLSLITSEDPFILIDDTIYVMTDKEYYASRVLLPANASVEKTFQKIISMEDITFMSENDKRFVTKVKRELPSCPSCKYKRYKDEVYKIAKSYNLVDYVQDNTPTYLYPSVFEPIIPLVSTLLDGMYKIPMPARKACIDCVEKHLSQAYILGNEVRMGYPEHLALVCGHLSEAIEEMPTYADALKETLIFCLARTIYTKAPFIPLHAIIPVLTMVRNYVAESDDATDDIRTEAPATMEIDFTHGMEDELLQLPVNTIQHLLAYLKTAQGSILKYKISPDAGIRMEFQGALACAADLSAEIAPTFANMLRNRRLLFKASPDLAIDSEYDMAAIIEWLTKMSQCQSLPCMTEVSYTQQPES